MVKRLAVSVVVLGLAFSAAAQGVSRVRPTPEVGLVHAWRGGVMSAQALGGYKLPDSASFRVTGATFQVNTAAATATVSMVLRVGDGTNTCDITIDCTSSDVRATGVKRSTNTSGACVFPRGALIAVSIATACTTAQPSATNIVFFGNWQ